MFRWSVCNCKICQNNNFNHNWLRLISFHSAFLTVGLPTVLGNIWGAAGIFTTWLHSSSVRDIFSFDFCDTRMWFPGTSAYSSVIASFPFVGIVLRDSLYPPVPTHPAAKTKVLSRTITMMWTSSMKELERKQGWNIWILKILCAIMWRILHYQIGKIINSALKNA